MKKTIMVLVALTFGAGAAFLYAGSGDLTLTGMLGVGTTSPEAQLTVSGAGQTAANFDTTGSLSGAVDLGDTGLSTGNGGAIVFSAHSQAWKFGAIKGYVTNGNNNSQGDIVFATRTNLTDPTLTEAMRIKSNGNVQIPHGRLGVGVGAASNAGITINGTTTAAGGQGQGIAIPSALTLAAAANGDVLAGIRINPAFSTGSYTGVQTFGVYANTTANNYFGGSVGIGAGSFGTGGSAALLFGNGSKPTSLSNVAGLRAGDISGGTTSLYVFDELGNENLVTPHAAVAPDWMYDAQDGLPMLVEEIQHFLGYVRYTNHTRQSRLAAMTDAEKSSLKAAQRTCVFTESFADHNARLGLTGDKALVKLDWETEQQAISAGRDAQILYAKQALASLETTIAAAQDPNATALLQAAIAAAQDPYAMAGLIQQKSAIQIPDPYVIKDPPPRLKAALASAMQ